MRELLTHVNRTFIFLLIILLAACASSSGRISNDYMQRAIENNKKGDLYEALSQAVQAYQYDNSNEEAKRFIKVNLSSAFAAAVDSLNKMKVRADELKSFRLEIYHLSKTQAYLKNNNFIQANIFEAEDIKVKYETKLSENLLKDIDAALKKEDSETSRRQIDELGALDLPKTVIFQLHSPVPFSGSFPRCSTLCWIF